MNEQATMVPPAAADVPDAVAPVDEDALVAEEELVEEVSIDGMCGVY